MKFDIITIFPELFESFKNESLLKKSGDKKLISIDAHNLRDFAIDKHHSVDDSPYGGGFGMVMRVNVIYRALSKLARLAKKGGKFLPAAKGTKVIMLTPRGKKFTQTVAAKLAREKRLIFICGRYEGIDERVASKLCDMELSIGDFDLMGGEVAAMVIIETVSRLIPGVIGRDGFLQERNTKDGFFESAQYTRPEVFSPKKGINWRVPKEFLSGDPKKVLAWRQKHGKTIS
jgi:tRNA (guanine37-N1)-methyltransferase